MVNENIPLDDVRAELNRRHGKTGNLKNFPQGGPQYMTQTEKHALWAQEEQSAEMHGWDFSHILTVR